MAAGAFETPKLLMLSGIGPNEELAKFDIPVIQELPVGDTLYEHPGVLGPVFTINRTIDENVNLDRVLNLKTIIDFTAGEGVFTSNSVEGLMYIKTPFAEDPDPGLPDVEIMQALTTLAFDTTPGNRLAFRVTQEVYDSYFVPLRQTRSFQYLPMLMQPRTKGKLRLKSDNPFNHPIFDYNYFEDDRDLEALVYGIKMAINVTGQEPFRRLGVELYTKPLLGCEHLEFNTHEYWRCYVMTLTATFHHQVGTTAMGKVVDERLNVYGISNLRIVDIGVLPLPVSAHTSAVAFMLGEKAADIIKDDSLVKFRRKRHAKSHIEEIVEETLPSADEDAIKMIVLQNSTKYGKGKGNPRVITEEFEKMNTTEYNDTDFNLIENSTVLSIARDGHVIQNLTFESHTGKVAKYWDHEEEEKDNKYSLEKSVSKHKKETN